MEDAPNDDNRLNAHGYEPGKTGSSGNVQLRSMQQQE